MLVDYHEEANNFYRELCFVSHRFKGEKMFMSRRRYDRISFGHFDGYRSFKNYFVLAVLHPGVLSWGSGEDEPDIVFGRSEALCTVLPNCYPPVWKSLFKNIIYHSVDSLLKLNAEELRVLLSRLVSDDSTKYLILAKHDFKYDDFTKERSLSSQDLHSTGVTEGTYDVIHVNKCHGQQKFTFYESVNLLYLKSLQPTKDSVIGLINTENHFSVNPLSNFSNELDAGIFQNRRRQKYLSFMKVVTRRSGEL